MAYTLPQSFQGGARQPRQKRLLVQVKLDIPAVRCTQQILTSALVGAVRQEVGEQLSLHGGGLVGIVVLEQVHVDVLELRDVRVPQQRAVCLLKFVQEGDVLLLILEVCEAGANCAAVAG